jgi:hypothetical protein
MDENGADVPFWAARYPLADISPSEFERFVATVFCAGSRT